MPLWRTDYFITVIQLTANQCHAGTVNRAGLSRTGHDFRRPPVRVGHFIPGTRYIRLASVVQHKLMSRIRRPDDATVTGQAAVSRNTEDGIHRV